ncbi:hypothetical protein E2C01_020413 [Portunus trituberculatus]|uniref:Uncharacterized protein n=1 Tax=Portunus trituberculatus TaxID=210409 RepID=A0A5B7E186_PORTR|nr:hypothetical protein [Portunus trituberculatus]
MDYGGTQFVRKYWSTFTKYSQWSSSGPGISILTEHLSTTRAPGATATETAAMISEAYGKVTTHSISSLTPTQSDMT